MVELGHFVYTPSLRFGIVKALGLVLGQDCDGAAKGMVSLLG